MTRRRALGFMIPAAAAAVPLVGTLTEDASAETTGSGSAMAINVQDYGAKGDGSTDDTSAIQSAIAAAGSAGQVVAPSGTYVISSLITVPDGVNFAGAGNSLSNAATTFKCTSGSAGIAIEGSGGTCRDFKVDGAQVARMPLSRGTQRSATGWPGSQRTFIAIDAVNSAQDNFTLYGSQNDTYISCNFQNAARDNLYIDCGAGGHSFVRCELNNPGRYNLRGDNAVSGGPYPYGPCNMLFAKCILERVGSSAVSAAYLSGCGGLRFEACEFYGINCQGPLIDVTNNSILISLDGGVVTGSSAKSETGARVAEGCELVISGRPLFEYLSQGIVLLSILSQVKLDGTDISWSNVATPYVAQGNASVESCVVSMVQSRPLAAMHDNPSDALLLSYKPNGLFFRLEASGKWSWGTADGYGPGDTNLYRETTGTLRTDGVLHAGGGIQTDGGVTTSGNVQSGGTVSAQAGIETAGTVQAQGGVHTEQTHTAVQGMHTDGPLSGGDGVRSGHGGVLASTIYSGRGAPARGLGRSGDFYFRSDAPRRKRRRLYVKAQGRWEGIL